MPDITRQNNPIHSTQSTHMAMRLKDQAYDHIFKKVVEGSLLPGMRLSNRGLAKEMGMSPIPVREAISQLVSEGLVEDRAREGAFVKQSSAAELWHLFELRIAIESYTAAHVAPLLKPEHLQAMTAHNQDMLAVLVEQEAAEQPCGNFDLVDRWLQADIGLHMVLFDVADNPQMRSLVSKLWIKTHVFVQRYKASPWEFTRSTYEDHCQLIETLRTGDSDRARTAMGEHIARGYKFVMAYLEVQPETKAKTSHGRVALLERLNDTRM